MDRFTAYLALVALAVVTPFERLRPAVTLPWQQVSNVELALAAAVAIWLVTLAVSRGRVYWRTPITAAWLLLLAALLIAALAAPSHHADALKIVARLAAGFVVYLLAVAGLSTPHRIGVTIGVVVGTAAIVATIAILEFAGLPSVLGWLNEFREGVRVIGGKVRPGGTLQYPTIAAMYFEIAFALGLGWLLWIWDGERPGPRRWAISAVAAALLLVVGEGLALTFTRAGLLGLAASAITIGVWRWRRSGFDAGARLVAGVSLVALILPLLSWSEEAVELRLSSEGRQGWYRAAFRAPESLSLPAGQEVEIPIVAINTGRVTWQSDPSLTETPFRASYHWLAADSNEVVQYDGTRSDFPGTVPPEASAEVDVAVHTPHIPGEYRLAWDVVQEHRLWFGTEPGARMAVTRVTIEPANRPVHPLLAGRGPRVLPPPTVVLGRLDLWRAALDVARAHPILGVGADNFRLVYGNYIGLPNADTRVHSNNMYLEVLTGAGLVGLLAFGYFLFKTRALVASTLARLSPGAASLYIGAAAAGVAVLVHGVFDSFLTFTPTYLSIALLVGIAGAPSAWNGGSVADRI